MNYFEYFERGTMQPVKQVLGAILIALGLAHVFALEQLAILENYKIFIGLFLLFSGYLLFIAGRRFPRGRRGFIRR